jgi:hypothetical protein
MLIRLASVDDAEEILAINTTLRYAMVKQSNVKWAHKKYVG